MVDKVSGGVQVYPERKHDGKVPPGWYEFIDTLSRLRNSNAITAATYAELRSAGKALAMAAWERGADDMTDAAAGVKTSALAHPENWPDRTFKVGDAVLIPGGRRGTVRSINPCQLKRYQVMISETQGGMFAGFELEPAAGVAIPREGQQ